MPDEERGTETELGDGVELVLTHHLTVLDAMTGVAPRNFSLRVPKGVQYVVDGRVAARVNRDRVAGAMELLDHRGQLRPGPARVATIGGGVLEGRVIRLGEVSGIALI